MNFYLILPAAIILLPVLGSGLVCWMSPKFKTSRGYLTALINLVTLVLIAVSYFMAKSNEIVVKYPFLPFSKMELSINPLSALLAFLTAFIWTAVAVYSIFYMNDVGKQKKFYAFLLLTFSANLGVFLAGNFLTLFVFFEILGISAYPLIVHAEEKKAFKAGTKYLVMVLLGDVALLIGVLLYCNITGNVNFATGIKGVSDYTKFIIFAFMGIGFGIKAGVMPLHIWLPDAHSVAPTPASALLSGVMIKAGAYGIIRSLFSIFGPEQSSIAIGFIVIWVGIVSMFVAVLMALLQENAKKMLAYHSISQMGYIILGIGCAIYLGAEGAIAIGGSLYHIVNHALFKSCLFLTVGAVYYRTGELNMYKLGGLIKKMPLIAFCTLVASLGISGIPPFNGYASKTLIHQALTHLEYCRWTGLANIFFILTCGGTIASFTKLFTLVFLGKTPKKYETVKDAPSFMIIGIVPLVFMIFLLGVLPSRFWVLFILPALKNLGYTTAALNSVKTFSILTLHDFQGLVLSLTAGIFMFVAGMKYGLFHIRFPRWFGINYWSEQFTFGFYFLLHRESQLIKTETLEKVKERIEKDHDAAGVFFDEETHVLRLLVFVFKRYVRRNCLKIKDFGVIKANRIIKYLCDSFLAEVYRDLSASETKKEFRLYVEDLNFSMLLVLFLLVLCFISIKLIN
ncbi:complex I subunit 5 family protein [Candidatus Oleimmundimicrobium sp.]|uniref:complex I subunit 5 family protein n=1 Tax=Candidatus Oleimmundimicrobium sp. TaxID=3060597 RepID=UPI002726108F|nr:complex I subunit 5 family protein [Candidatus Oleimmundimicrobium sp.]MDO8886893.1 complex I subunit 5 family protein [Candidatus Oleimmundimicrobium sp.]